MSAALGRQHGKLQNMLTDCFIPAYLYHNRLPQKASKVFLIKVRK